MLKTILKFFAVVVISLIVILGFVRLFSGEDDWICKNGEWIKHGAPSGGPPNKKCEQLEVSDASGKNSQQDETLVTVKLFFSNIKTDPQAMNCNKTYPAEREIIETDDLIIKTMETLLLGPDDEEKESGFVTSINSGVKIRSFKIENGVAKIDFNDTLEFQVGGSCRVAAISSQIRETLRQFSEINDVIISIDGRTEDILQP